MASGDANPGELTKAEKPRAPASGPRDSVIDLRTANGQICGKSMK
jgi:hypothetical protein